MAEITRVDDVPRECPSCGKVVNWMPYYLIKGAPAAGCGQCGHIIYFTKMPARWERRSVRK